MIIPPGPGDEQNKISTCGFIFGWVRYAINKQINTYFVYLQVERSKGLSMLILELCSSPTVINELAMVLELTFRTPESIQNLQWAEEDLEKEADALW